MLSLLLSSALTCHIVYSPGYNWDSKLRLRHELAHVNGWRPAHPEPQEPPASFVHPYRGKLITRLMSTEDAKVRCQGLEACMWCCPAGIDACPNINLDFAAEVEGD